MHSYACSMLIYDSAYMSESISARKRLTNGFIYATKDDVEVCMCVCVCDQVLVVRLPVCFRDPQRLPT